MLTLGLDIGGTKIAAGLIGPSGELVHTFVEPTPRSTVAEDVWSVVERLIGRAVTAAGGALRGVGIGSAGPVDVVAGTVSPINIPAWQQFPVCARAVAAVPGVPVRLAGDGVCMALAEQCHGAARGAAFVLGMVVSTGVGGGLILNGEPYHGRTGNAGHVGHVVVDAGGARCVCGGRGCVETVASGPSMARWAQAQGWDGPVDPIVLGHAAAAGDPLALSAFHRSAIALAAMIASVGAVCDLDLVVIGGGVARSGSVLFDPLRAALKDFTGLSFLGGLQVVPASLGGDAGVIGAAALITSVT